MPWAHEADYDALITAAATAHLLDPALVKGLIATESGFDRNAVGDDGASLGLMQVQPGTARLVGVTGDLNDPRTNLAAGCAYLAQQIMRAGGDVAGGISAYNGGWRPLLGFGKPLLTTGAYRNQAYVDSVLTHWQYFRAQAAPPANPPVGSGPTDGAAVLPVILAGTVVAIVGVVWLLLR